MHESIHKYGPVLRWVRILVDALRDHLPKACPLCKPFPADPCNRMPSNLHSPKRSTDCCFARWHYVWATTQTGCFFETSFGRKGAFECLVLAVVIMLAQYVSNEDGLTYKKVVILLPVDSFSSSGIVSGSGSAISGGRGGCGDFDFDLFQKGIAIT